MLASRCIVCLSPWVLAIACSEDPGTPTGAGTATSTTGAATSTTVTTGTATGTTGAATSTTGTVTGTTGAATTGTVTGTTGDGTGTATTGGADLGNLPADSSAASISAFLQASGYTDASWTSIHAAPEASPSHGSLARVYFSSALVAARTANPDPFVAPTAAGVMAVKEFYDEAQTVIGNAVMYYQQEGSLVYYCYGPAAACPGTNADTTIDAPAWGVATDQAVSQCRICHGGNIFTELP